jgi:Flp pilus assembly protein TadD
MNPTSESQLSPSPKNWMGITETVAVVGSVGTAIAALASQQFAGLAALPLSISLALSLANRNRMLTQINQQHISQMEFLSQARQEDQHAIAALAVQTKSFGTHLVDITSNITHNETLAAANAQRLKSLTDIVEAHGIAQREMATQLVHLQKATAKPDEFYYEDGMNHQQAGHLNEAVASFNLAIRANESMAEAYYQRGLAQAELGQRQLAIADLRVAASLFFEQGKLEHYQKAKDLSKNVHEAMAEREAQAMISKPKALDAINVEHLFN